MDTATDIVESSEDKDLENNATESSRDFLAFDVLQEEPMMACNEREEIAELAMAAGSAPQSEPEKELSAVWQQESEFLDYMLYSLHGSDKGKISADELLINASSKTGPKKNKPDTSSAKIGLDHLDNLCKLMEQLGELRDQNVKLQRRVQYLEDMKTLQEMHRDLQLGLDENSSACVRKCSTDSLVVDYAVLENANKGTQCLPQLVRQHAVAMEECMEVEAELLASTNLVESAIAMQSLQATYVVAERTHKPKTSHMRFKKPSLMKYRQRSKSVGYDDPTNNPRAANSSPANGVAEEGAAALPSELQSSASPPIAVRNKTKVSKWTRVKEAFGWEKPQEIVVYKTVKGTGESDKISMNSAVLPDVSKSDAISCKLDADLDEPPEGPLAEGGMSSSSSSSSSICLLESEILKSLAEAQEALGAASQYRRASTLGFGIVPSSRMGSKKCKNDVSSRPYHISPCHRPNSVGFEGEAELWLSKTQLRHDGKYVPVTKEFDQVLEVWKYHDEPSFEEELISIDQEKSNAGSSMPHPTSSADVSGVPSKRQKPCLTISVPSEDTPDLSSLETGLLGPDAVATTKFLPRVVGETPKTIMVNMTSISASASTATAGERDRPKKNYSPPALLSKARVCSLETAATSSTSGYRRSPHTKWSRVKKAFLSTKRDPRQARSVPSSPNKLRSFDFDENLLSESDASRDPSPTDARKSCSISPSELKERKEELAQALSQPRSIEPELIPVVTPLFQSVAKETVTNLAPEFAKRAEPLNKQRASLLLNAEPAAEDLPAEFRKKLRDWERMKQDPKYQAKANTSGSASAGTRDNSKEKNRASIEQLPPDFKKKLTEWENRKAQAPPALGKPEQAVESLPEEFKRKLQEWEKIKASGVHLGKPASPKLDRKGSASQRRKTKSNKSSKDEVAYDRHSAIKQKTDIVYREKQKDKDLQWLEKELQKIEKEKQRLEREREKYMEREMRLEKMRQAMKQPQLHKEICIKTSTGEFRFEGISHKFTKKLWEWEEQRGIRPEASTIALLDPQHVIAEKPPRNARPKTKSLIRSKSEGSLADLTSPSVHSQPSSLSLNETGFDYDQNTTKIKEHKNREREAQAQWQVKRYRENKTPDELGSSSEWESKRTSACISNIGDSTSQVQRSHSVRTQASYQLLQENMALLNSLRDQEDIYRNLESQMTSLEGTMAGIEDTTGRLRERESSVKKEFSNELHKSHEVEDLVEDLKQRIATLEQHGDRLKAEKQQLQSFFEQHIQKQSSLAQQLVNKMKELEIVSRKIPATVNEESAYGSIIGEDGLTDEKTDPTALARIQVLSSELISHAQELEKAVAERIESINQSPTEFTVPKTQHPIHQSLSVELSNKVHELQEELLRLEPPTTSTMYQVIPRESQAEPAPLEIEVDESILRNVFVPTQRAIFCQAPLSGQVPAIIRISPDTQPPSTDSPCHGQDSDESEVPWRRQRETPSPEVPSQSPNFVPFPSSVSPTIKITTDTNTEEIKSSDLTPWRKKSGSTSTPTPRNSTTSSEDFRNSTPSPQPQSSLSHPLCPQLDQKLTVRETAPNIKLMIAKYNAKASNSGKETKPTSPISILPLTLRPKELKTECQVSLTFGSPSTSTKQLDGTLEESNTETEPKANLLPAPIAICKSHSASSIIPQTSSSLLSANSAGSSGIIRSQSGNACNYFSKHKSFTSPVRKSPERTPSFFARTSPLDPSIDETLHKYRNRGKINAVPDLPRSPAMKERAARLKKVREEFLTLESVSPPPTTPSISSCFQFPRCSTIAGSMESSPANSSFFASPKRMSTTSEESEDRSISPDLQISKSASAGTVPRHEGKHSKLKRLTQRKSNTLGAGSTLHPSMQPKEQEDVLVLKQSKFYAVSALCRQSLLVDIAEPNSNSDPTDVSIQASSAAESDELSRSCPNSPALGKSRSSSKTPWFLQPKKLFRKKSPQP